MKTSIDISKKTIAIVLIVLMTSIMVIADVPNVTNVQGAEVVTSGPLPAGKTPAFNTPTVCSLSARPALVGKGQYILVNAWLNPAVSAGRIVSTYVFTITAPDGTNTTWKQDAEASTAATWFDYTIDQVGTWTINCYFTGCYFNGSATEATQSAYYQPSSAPAQTITCQQDFNPSWPAVQLPTGYWTRPVDFTHREWGSILGNYPATGYDGSADPQWSTRYPDTNPRWSATYGLIPWVQAPHSSHIVWLALDQPAGVVGGQTGQGGNTIGSDLSTSSLLCNLAYAGRGYRTITRTMPTMINGTTYQQPVSVWECFDIRTGQIYWDLTGQSQIPTLIEYSTSVTTAAMSGGAVTGSLLYLSASRMVKYNPITGAVTANVSFTDTVPALSNTVYYKNQCVLSVQNLGNTTSPNYRLINWTTAGTSTNFTSRISPNGNTTYELSSVPSVTDWNTGYSATVSGITTAGVMSGVRAIGYETWTGKLLWNKTIPGVTLYSGSCTVADHGLVAFSLSQMNGKYGAYMALNQVTGEQAWVSDTMDYPWSSTGFGSYGVASAYGLIIHPAYSGLTAINWTNGHIEWTYHKYALAPFESPYTDANQTEVYSFNSGLEIADGVLFAYNCEHTTTWPRARGWSTVAVDMTNGKELWSIALPGNAAFGNSPDIGVITDGYMNMMSDLGYFVTYGKGQSATTVTAPDVVMAQGNGVVIKGTVLDLSPAQPNTPCVSKESMTLQMEYLHLNNPIDGLWSNQTVIGVPVTLTAIGSDGAVYDLGTVTTDGYSGSFAKTWTPPTQGDYKIIASFAGDESYGNSMSTTALSVGPAPAATASPIPIATAADYTLTIMEAAIAIIIAVIIGFAITIIILKKR